MPTVTETVVLTSGTSWTVPYTWNNLNNSVICIGGGAGGGGVSCGGGGGGTRSTSYNLTLTKGSTVSYSIGAGGSAGTAGGDTTFNSSAIVAKGGSSTATATGGLGGSASSSVGNSKLSGGNGGVGQADVGGGGGGAGGDFGGGISGSSGNSGTASGGAGGRGGTSGALNITCRYVRWNVASTKGYELRASEFKLATSGESPVSISSVTATYGNSETSDPGTTSNGPSNLIDGSTSTKFVSSNSSGPWLITFDLGSQKTFSYYYWTTSPDSVLYDPYSWSLESSDDGINWTTINYFFNYAGTNTRSYQLGGFFANFLNGGEGGAAGYSSTPGAIGKNGFPSGKGLNAFYTEQYGLNYAGGGGGGGGYTSGKGGSTYGGGTGGPLGGGGGGNGSASGAQGGIIINWTYDNKLQSAGQQISMSDITNVLGTSSSISLADAAVRTAFGVSSGAISFSNGYDKYKIPTLVTYINTTGYGQTSVSLLSGGSNYGGWQTDDLALAFVQDSQTIIQEQLNRADWTYLGYVYSPHGYFLVVFSRILVQGDSVFNFTGSYYGGCHILILRGGSKATIRRNVVSYASTTVSFTGITKSAGSKALVSFLSNRSLPASPAMTAPSGWTEVGAASWPIFYAESALINASSYTNGSTISWTGVDINNNYYKTGFIIEIT
jgi:hypothetical protein